jgi:cysteine-rich repeat protein
MEECDDGNDEDGDDCPGSCADAFCGDGFHHLNDEECDDGNNQSNDGCTPQCIAEFDQQCNQAYSTMDEADRLDSFNDGNSNVEFCDRPGGSQSTDWNGPGWYRLAANGGTGRMPEGVPVAYDCGTDAPGWLNGTHPSVADGVVDRQVCFNWSNNQCNWNSAVKVVNCANFYLYEFPEAPACALRYCEED